MKSPLSITNCILHLILLRIPSACASAETADSSQANVIAPTLRWASTGGGWRSQFACVGFANLFGQLDIMSKFSAISTTSGASWFSTQLFYSQQFYDGVVDAEDSQALYDFVVEWMNAYSQMLTETIESSEMMTKELEDEICNTTDLGDSESVQNLSDLCHTIVYFGGDWADMMEKMLDYAAKSYGDTEFISKMAGYDNMLGVLQGTELLIQGTLVPNSRIRLANESSSSSSDSDIAVYIGPNDSSTIYTTPLSAVYIVNASGTSYQYSTESVQGDMDVGTAQTPSKYSFDDWGSFYLYPGDDGTTHIEDFTRTWGTKNSLSKAFGGGQSTVVQVAAISSAVAGQQSPLAPSTFSQKYSQDRYDLEQNGTALMLSLYDRAVARMYNQPMLDNFAVCNQWPNSCGASDGYFIDGGFSDGPSLVINVAQYQMTSGGELNQTLKVILTNTNEAWGSAYQYTQVLQYFESPVNQNIAPGAFNWRKGFSLPCQSTQIFEELMNESTLDSLIEPISDSNMTTAILKGTTINSPIFNIKAGQSVEILLINLNEPITTFLVTPDISELYTEPLADMTVHIAENEELAKRIKLFVEPALIHDDVDVDDMSTPSPSSGHPILTGVQFSTVAALYLYFFLGAYPFMWGY